MRDSKSTSAYTILALVFIGLLGCTKEDHFYKEFVDTRIKHYSGKADSVKVLPGENRAKLTWLLNDPLVNQATIFWNGHKDSIMVDISGNVSSWEVIIPNLTENSHTFSIVTKDKNGNQSIPVQATGVVFGEKFKNTLFNRTVKSVTYSSKALTINWEPESSETSIGTEISYIANNGSTKKVMCPINESKFVLEDFKVGSEFQYRTGFLPAPTAIDTFYSSVKTQTTEYEELLDWSKFVEVKLATDTWQPHSSLLTTMNKMWNDNITDPANAFLTNPNQSPIPQWFTFDLGASQSLSSIRIWHRATFFYNIGNLKKFEVYGSNTADMDGSWTNWTLIGNFQSVKPSGLPVGQNSPADITYISAGEKFRFPAGLPPYRYLRFKTLEIWGDVKYICIQKMQVFSNVSN